MPQYNSEFLAECIAKNSAILVGSYEHLTIKSRIYFQCKCGNEGNKNFKCASVYGFCCDDCTKANCKRKATERSLKIVETITYNWEILESYIKRDSATLNCELPKLHKEARIIYTCNCGNKGNKTFRYIRQTGMFCRECTFKHRSEKREHTNMELYGNKCTLQSDTIKEKAEETCLRKYGVKNVFESNEIQNKIKETNLEKYGAENPYASKEIISKIRKNCKEKYGTEFPMQTQELKEKTIKTNMEKYGVPSTAQAECVKEKARHTNLLVYGVEHPSQSQEIQEKIQKNGLRFKTYTCPSDACRKIQGYEHFALNRLFLIDKLNESDVHTDRKEVPRIPYTDNSKQRYYFPDIWIKSQNKLIEVKSWWTYKLHKETNILKWKASCENGYKHEFWIFTPKGNLTIITDPETTETI